MVIEFLFGRVMLISTIYEHVPRMWSGFFTKTQEWKSPPALLTNSNWAQGLG